MSAVFPAPPVVRTKPAPNPMVMGLKTFASLRLTVALLGMSIFLVFVGTLAQIDGGIWTIVSKYFRSWFVLVPLQLFWQLGEVFLGLGHHTIPGFIPFPGGWTLGGLLMLNLIAAHALRFRLQWKRAGVLVLHTGLIILMLGELITGLFQVEARMLIGPNETVNFTENSRAVELAIIDRDDLKENVEYTIPESMLARGGKITSPALPVDVEIVEYMKNARLSPLEKGETANEIYKSKVGVRFAFQKASEASGVDTNAQTDAPAARVKFYRKGTDEVLDSAVVSLYFSPNFTQRLPIYQFSPQEFRLDGKTYRFELRGQREYLPFSLKLNEFRFDRYPGTQKPRNYSSLVTLSDPRTGANRDVLIRMNEPLAYEGATYYQADFTRHDEKGTILQVTRNPGVWLPYISCAMIVFGMLVHFGQKLVHFLSTTVRA
jgi:ResB-like family